MHSNCNLVLHQKDGEDVMYGWAMRGSLTGDVEISRNSTGPFGPMGMFFVDRSKAFSSTDEVTDNVQC